MLKITTCHLDKEYEVLGLVQGNVVRSKHLGRDIAAGFKNLNEDHVRDFPPTRIIHCADDDLVNPEHSRILKQALDAAGILSELEMDARGGHGFAEGTGTDAEGWIDRTAAFFAKTIAI